MAEYRNDGTGTTRVERRSSMPLILGIIAVLALIAVVLFATGFWKANVTPGAMPDVKVSAKGGALPDVNVQSKKVVVGTKDTTVDVPKVETKKETISVPVVGVKDGDKK